VFGAMGSIIGSMKRRHSITADAKAIIEKEIMQVVFILIFTARAMLALQALY